MRHLLYGLLFSIFAYSPVVAADVSISKIILITHPTDQPLPHQQIWIDPQLATRKEAVPLRHELKAFIGTDLTTEQLDSLKKCVADFFFHERHLLTAVVIPPQEVSQGAVQVVVLYSTLDQVTLEGNRWTSNRWILNRTHLQMGKPLRTDLLESNLAWLNRSPFRRTDLILTPGSQPGTTSTTLVTKERFPFRPYIGGDNTGTSYTSYTRWFTGFQAGNLFGWDQQTSYQFTMASDPYVFIAHNATYTIPFPWKHQLYTYGGWSRTHGDLPEHEIHNRCVDWQVSPRYQIPILPLYGNRLQEITLGYDFKRTENEMLFKGSSFSQTTADINQFLIGYTFRYKNLRCTTAFTAEVFAAPAQLTADQTDEQYETIRPFASSRYGYLRIQGAHTHTLPYRMSIKASIMAQGTAWNLLPSEQLGIGGYNTVRGYEERGLNVDNALMASLEFTAPPTRLFAWRKGNPRQEQLQFLAFFDYGWGQLYHADAGQKATDWMLGIGPGVRYLLDTHVTFRADLGFPLHPAGLGRQGIHLHVGGTLAF